MLLAEQMRGVRGDGPVLQPTRQVINQRKAFGLKWTSVQVSHTHHEELGSDWTRSILKAYSSVEKHGW